MHNGKVEINMKTSEKIALYAESIVGKSRRDLNLFQSTEWCAETVSHVITQTIPSEKSVTDISCNAMIRKMRNSPNFYEPEDEMKRGDFLFPDWDKDRDPLRDSKPLDHVVIVTKYKDGYVTYVDGNSDDSGIVRKHEVPVSTFNFNCRYPDYYMRYCGPEEDEQHEEKEPETVPDSDVCSITLKVLKKGDRGENVKALQRLLFACGYSVGSYGDDGVFGDCTEKALRNFQKEHNLSETSVCDADTWKKLHEV